jgi:hypothetical protein
MNDMRIAEVPGEEPRPTVYFRFQQINNHAEELGEELSSDALLLLQKIHKLRPGIMLGELLRILNGPTKPRPRTTAAGARQEPGGAS